MGIVKDIKQRIKEKQAIKEARQIQEEKSDREIKAEKLGRESYPMFQMKIDESVSKSGQFSLEVLPYSDEKGYQGIETKKTYYNGEFGPVTQRIVERSRVTKDGYTQVSNFTNYEGWLPDSENPGYYNITTTELSLSNPVKRETTFCKDYDGVYMNPEGEFEVSSGRRVTSSENNDVRDIGFGDKNTAIQAVDMFDAMIAQAENAKTVDTDNVMSDN